MINTQEPFILLGKTVRQGNNHFPPIVIMEFLNNTFKFFKKYNMYDFYHGHTHSWTIFNRQ